MAYTTIRNGSKGSDVKTWQNYLKSQGYDIGSAGADGVFGNATAKATKQYQKDKGLTADGIVGSNTWASMNTGSNTKTTSTKKNVPKINGVDNSVMKTATSDFKESDTAKGLKTEKDKYKQNAMDYLSNTDIIDQSVYDKLGEEWAVPEEVTQADAWLNEQLGKIQSGKTSWSDQYNSAINDYLNREDFEYDVDNDQLFQQALASAMNSGKTAMQDTIGQASALTGGYGSTYATSAGNQAYNQFIEDAYNNLPEYYQMAMEAYQMEGQEMLNRVNLLGTADEKEYSRMVDAYSLTADHRNRMYDEAYSIFRDEKTDAYNIANLKLTENSTIASNLMGAYNIAASEYENQYTREFNQWQADVNNAMQLAGMQNSDYWANKNFKASYTSAAKDGYVIRKDKNGNSVSYKLPTEKQIKAALDAYNKDMENNDENLTEYNKYLDSLIGIDETTIEEYIAQHGTEQLEYRTFSMHDDTMNGFLGLGNFYNDYDPDDVVIDQYGNKYEIQDLPESIRTHLTDLAEGEGSYTKPKKTKK